MKSGDSHGQLILMLTENVSLKCFYGYYQSMSQTLPFCYVRDYSNNPADLYHDTQKY